MIENTSDPNLDLLQEVLERLDEYELYSGIDLSVYERPDGLQPIFYSKSSRKLTLSPVHGDTIYLTEFRQVIPLKMDYLKRQFRSRMQSEAKRLIRNMARPPEEQELDDWQVTLHVNPFLGMGIDLASPWLYMLGYRLPDPNMNDYLRGRFELYFKTGNRVPDLVIERSPVDTKPIRDLCINELIQSYNRNRTSLALERLSILAGKEVAVRTTLSRLNISPDDTIGDIGLRIMFLANDISAILDYKLRYNWEEETKDVIELTRKKVLGAIRSSLPEGSELPTFIRDELGKIANILGQYKSDWLP